MMGEHPLATGQAGGDTPGINVAHEHLLQGTRPYWLALDIAGHAAAHLNTQHWYSTSCSLEWRRPGRLNSSRSSSAPSRMAVASFFCFFDSSSWEMQTMQQSALWPCQCDEGSCCQLPDRSACQNFARWLVLRSCKGTHWFNLCLAEAQKSCCHLSSWQSLQSSCLVASKDTGNQGHVSPPTMSERSMKSECSAQMLPSGSVYSACSADQEISVLPSASSPRLKHAPCAWTKMVKGADDDVSRWSGAAAEPPPRRWEHAPCAHAGVGRQMMALWLLSLVSAAGMPQAAVLFMTAGSVRHWKASSKLDNCADGDALNVTTRTNLSSQTVAMSISHRTSSDRSKWYTSPPSS